MKFLIDHDVYAVTARLLVGLGHDAVRVADMGLAQSPDNALLRAAIQESRILVTRDRDFGNLVFVQNIICGVIYLRMQPSTVAVAHAELERVLLLYTESELLTAFVVVEPGRHRIRRLAP